MKFGNSDLVNIKLEDKHHIISMIKQDIAFLESNNLMDYSLLLAIEEINITSSKVHQLSIWDMNRNTLKSSFKPQ